MKKVVVLGGGGFIGGHLIHKLKELGNWVKGVDIKHNEFRPTNADEFIIADLRDPIKVDEVIEKAPLLPAVAEPKSVDPL